MVVGTIAVTRGPGLDGVSAIHAAGTGGAPVRAARDLSGGASAARIVAAAVVLALVGGAVSARYPLAGLGAGAIIILGLAAALVIPRLRAFAVARASTLPAEFYRQAPVALMFASLAQIFYKSATSSSVGLAGIYEFALEGLAVVVTLLGIQSGKLRVALPAPALLWALVGALAMVSEAWAPSSTLALLKGGQLLTIGLVVPLLSVNFASREEAARFLGRFGAGLMALLAVIQAVVSKPSSLYRAYELGNPMYVDGRVRLSLMQIYPLTLGIMAGALVVLLLVNQPKRADWLAIAFLVVLQYLSFSRGPTAILAGTVVLYVLLRVLGRLAGSTIGGIGTAVGLLAILAAFVLAVSNSPALVGMLGHFLPSDTSSLNGRLPVWRDTINQIVLAAQTPAGALFGHGFASFRFYGLDKFSYAGETHNAPLQVAYEMGLLGLTLWLAAVTACAVQVWNSRVGLVNNLIRLLPILYIVLVELTDSSLADSRSWVLLILLFYSWRFRDGQPRRVEEPATAGPPTRVRLRAL